MSPWWLVLIIPISGAAGYALAAVLSEAKKADRELEKAAEPKPVTVKVTRYIPQDLWMEKVLALDVKGANAWLAISMGQMLGPELAPHTTVMAQYRPKENDYQVTAWVRVFPREARK